MSVLYPAMRLNHRERSREGAEYIVTSRGAEARGQRWRPLYRYQTTTTKKIWWPAIGQIQIFRSSATWAELAITATSFDTLIIQNRALSNLECCETLPSLKSTHSSLFLYDANILIKPS